MTESTAEKIEKSWTIPHRILFRFAFAYFFFSSFSQIVARIGGSLLAIPIFALWNLMIPLLAAILHIPGPLTNSDSNGSGDTTYNYMILLCELIGAFVVTIIWSLIDFKRKNYDILYKWFRLLLRLGLGSAMISYGAFKVVPSQFPPPGLFRMIETYGESSPMGLLWTFMGSSTEYSTFVGLAEMIAGCLLMFPRFTLLGALIGFAVTTNIFMLNMCYDVPVKIYSFQLLMTSVLLIAPDFQRILDFFVRHLPVQLDTDAPLFSRKNLNDAAITVQVIYGLVIMVGSLDSSIGSSRKYCSQRAKPPLYGIWMVDDLKISGKEQPLSDVHRWRYLVFEHGDNIGVQHMDRSRAYYGIKWDKIQKSFALVAGKNSTWKANFTVDHPDANKLALTGDFDGYPTEMKLHKLDDSALLLTKRGFHWINEYPFNR